MDTKLKNISRNKTMKLMAFILIVILITAAMVQVYYISYLDPVFESLFVKEYKDSQDFLYNLHSVVDQTSYLMENEDERDEISKELAYYYYITDGENIFTNAPKEEKSFFEQYETFYAFENDRWSGGVGFEHIYPLEQEYTVYLAFPDDYMKAKQQEWKENADLILPFIISIIICSVLALFLIIYLIRVTGRNPEDDELHLSRIDNIYSDILFLALAFIMASWIAIISSSFYYHIDQRLNQFRMDEIYSISLSGITTTIAAILCGIILLSMVRKIKARKFIKHSLVYRMKDFIIGAFLRMKDAFKALFDGRKFEKYPLTKKLFYRQLVFIIGSGILVFFTFLSLLFPPFILITISLEAVIIYWYIKYNNKTYEEINKGFNESLEEQMKSERMKIDLVTNVSHDLKTPLTSIISYIDLLSKEDDLSESAKDYINILSDKSNRLKQIVSGLFDLAKSTSGDINLKLETLDLKKLIEQTLGDMKDEIENSGLQIKTNLPDKGIYIVSDGEKMYRIFQNVIDNALRYSLNGTRVYIDVEDVNGKGVATIKNIADYEMDFTAEEILQRFNRGDGSRTTDGSGLGLSIAESFANVCGGDFEVDIDGDLFKVTIKFDIKG